MYMTIAEKYGKAFADLRASIQDESINSYCDDCPLDAIDDITRSYALFEDGSVVVESIEPDCFEFSMTSYTKGRFLEYSAGTPLHDYKNPGGCAIREDGSVIGLYDAAIDHFWPGERKPIFLEAKLPAGGQLQDQ